MNLNYTYLLHFDRPLAHAKHYCGWTPISVEARLKKHIQGQGAKLTKAVVESGRCLAVAQTWAWSSWQEARDFERHLKSRHRLADFCPICKENNAKRREG